MPTNPNERDIARSFGFGRKLPTPSSRVGDGRPESLYARLGIRPGTSVALVGVDDRLAATWRADSVARISSLMPREPVEVLVYQAESVWALRRISELARLVRQGGALWVLWPSGQGHITASHVHRAGITAGLVDKQSTQLSARLMAMKFTRRSFNR